MKTEFGRKSFNVAGEDVFDSVSFPARKWSARVIFRDNFNNHVIISIFSVCIFNSTRDPIDNSMLITMMGYSC